MMPQPLQTMCGANMLAQGVRLLSVSCYLCHQASWARQCAAKDGTETASDNASVDRGPAASSRTVARRPGAAADAHGYSTARPQQLAPLRAYAASLRSCRLSRVACATRRAEGRLVTRGTARTRSPVKGCRHGSRPMVVGNTRQESAMMKFSQTPRRSILALVAVPT